jgi:hypothetical protein
MAHTINRPKRFPGSDTEIAANRATHAWREGWCDRCGCRDRHVHADWPCGTDVPREILTIEDDTTEDAEPVTGEFVPASEQLIDHPRLTVTGDGYDVRVEGNALLSNYEAAQLARRLKQHLEANGYTI